MNKEQLAELDAMSGTGQQTTQLFKLDEISIHGSKGFFVAKRKTQDLVETNGIKKYPKDKLGETISLVFLKKRRMLIERGEKGKTIRSTNEHNTPASVVTLFQDVKDEVGVAKDLRERHEGLKTNEIIYAMDMKTNQVYRVIFKGSSLKMEEDKAKGDTLYLYDYLKTFTGDDKFFMYETTLSVKELEGDLGTFYAIQLKRGRKVTDEEFTKIADKIREIHANCEAVDVRYQTQSTVTKSDSTPDLSVIDYGDVDDVDDIPF